MSKNKSVKNVSVSADLIAASLNVQSVYRKFLEVCRSLFVLSTFSKQGNFSFCPISFGPIH